MKFAFWLLIGLAAVAAEAAHAQPPDWMLDNQFMPHRGRLGVRVQPMTEGLRKFFEVPPNRGVLVAEVEPDRPAATAGVSVGDVIVAGGDVPIREPYDLVKAVARVPAGEKLVLIVSRKGEEQKVEVAPDGDPVPSWTDAGRWRNWFDRHMREGGQQLRERLHDLEERLGEIERQLNQSGSPPQTAL